MTAMHQAQVSPRPQKVAIAVKPAVLPAAKQAKPSTEPPLAQHRAAQMLKALTSAELADLDKLVESNLFCPDMDARRLMRAFLALAAKNPNFDKAENSRTRLFFHAYGLKREDPARLDKALTGLVAAIESFMIFAQLQKDPVQKAFYKVKWAAGTADKAVFDDSVARMERALAATPESHHKLYQAFRLECEAFAFPHADRHGHKRAAFRRAEAAHLQYCATLDAAFRFGSRVHAQLLGETPKNAAQMPPKSSLLALYEQIEPFSQAEKFSKPEFDRCFSMLKKHFSDIEPSERETVFRVLANTCTSHIYSDKSAERQCYACLHDLYSWAIEQKGFTERWLRSDDDYLNVAATFGRTNLDTLERFIANQHSTTPHRDAEAYAKASLSFHRKDFHEADRLMRSIQNRHNKYLIRKHLLLLRIAVELFLTDKQPALEACKQEMEAFGRYFERNDVLAEGRRASYLRELSIVRKIVAWHQKPRKNIADFKAKMLQELDDPEQPTPVGRDWLRAKIEE